MRLPAKTASEFRFRTERKPGEALYEAIAGEIREMAESGVLKAGAVLPSVRRAAESLGVSVKPVIAAYRMLEAEGVISAAERSGFRVCSSEKRKKPQHSSENEEAVRLPSPPLSALAPAARGAAIEFAPKNFENRPFRLYRPVMGRETEKAWVKLASDTARSPWRHTFYGEAAGYLPLRRLIARRLAEEKGIRASEKQIIITNGTVQSLAIVSRVLFNPGDTVWLEAPSYPLYRGAFSFAGVRTAEIPSDRGGLSVSEGERIAPAAKGVLVSPASSLPLSITMTGSRRAELAARAAAKNTWIIENGTDDLVWYGRGRELPLRALPGAGRFTVYMESFSLQIFPAIRLGFLLVPEGTEDAFAGTKLLLDRFTPENTQDLLCRYLDSESCAQHMRRMTRLYRTQFELLSELVRKELAFFARMTETRCGPHVYLELIPELPDSLYKKRLREKGVTVKSLGDYGTEKSPMNGILLGFGAFSEKEVREAVRIMRETAEEMLQANSV